MTVTVIENNDGGFIKNSILQIFIFNNCNFVVSVLPSPK